jgi:ribosomal protein S18 acetylase RimI-like enzyme
MKYRIGTHKDHAEIEDVIASTEVYPPVDATLLDGTWVVAEDNEGQLVGCVWVMHHKRSAYIDYLCVRKDRQHKGIGVRLMLKLRQVLKRRGIRYVRGLVHLANEEAIKLDLALGGVADAPYALIYTDLGVADG